MQRPKHFKQTLTDSVGIMIMSLNTVILTGHELTFYRLQAEF